MGQTVVQYTMGNSASEQKLEQDIERVKQEIGAKYLVFLIGDGGIGKRVLLYKMLGDEDEAQKQSAIPLEPCGTGMGGGIPLTVGNVEVAFCSAEHDQATKMIRYNDMNQSDILVVCVKDHSRSCDEQIKNALQDYCDCLKRENLSLGMPAKPCRAVIIAYLNTPEDKQCPQAKEIAAKFVSAPCVVVDVGDPLQGADNLKAAIKDILEIK